MNQQPSSVLKVAYCLVLVAAILPFGLAESGWVGLVIGGTGLGLVPSLGPSAFICLALYRIFLVTRAPRTLDSPRATGIPAVMRALGIFLLYVGSLSAVSMWIVRPLMSVLLNARTDIGAEFYMEFYAYMAGGIGMLGLALFESSRLLAFERHAKQACMASQTKSAMLVTYDQAPQG